MTTVQGQRRILIIDDSITVRKIIEGILLKNGYLVDSFSNGLDAMMALTRGQTNVPDLVLLDIGLPQMDGYNIARLFRQKKELQDTIIVMVSGRDGFIDKVRGQMAGAKHYITKPFEPGEVLETVNHLLKGLRREKNRR